MFVHMLVPGLLVLYKYDHMVLVLCVSKLLNTETVRRCIGIGVL